MKTRLFNFERSFIPYFYLQYHNLVDKKFLNCSEAKKVTFISAVLFIFCGFCQTNTHIFLWGNINSFILLNYESSIKIEITNKINRKNYQFYSYWYISLFQQFESWKVLYQRRLFSFFLGTRNLILQSRPSTQ